MPDEEAFSLLVRLMYSYDVRGHFVSRIFNLEACHLTSFQLPEMPKLLLRMVSDHSNLAFDSAEPLQVSGMVDTHVLWCPAMTVSSLIDC